MSNKDIPSLLTELLEAEDLDRLRFIHGIKDKENKQILLKGFFHQKRIFDLVGKYYDPTWLAYNIFINEGKYEF